MMYNSEFLTKDLYITTAGEIISTIAKWATAQHHMFKPPGLDYLADQILYAVANDPERWGRITHNYFHTFFEDRNDIENWLREKIFYENSPMGILWNTPISGPVDVLFVATSRYDYIKLEYEFIDIDALLRNVSVEIMKNASESKAEIKQFNKDWENSQNKGIPIPIDMLAAAAGVELPSTSETDKQ